MSDLDWLPTPRRYYVMTCILLGVVLSSLDSAIVNIASPTIARELRASDAGTIWVVRSPPACWSHLGRRWSLLPRRSPVA